MSLQDPLSEDGPRRSPSGFTSRATAAAPPFSAVTWGLGGLAPPSFITLNLLQDPLLLPRLPVRSPSHLRPLAERSSPSTPHREVSSLSNRLLSGFQTMTPSLALPEYSFSLGFLVPVMVSGLKWGQGSVWSWPAILLPFSLVSSLQALQPQITGAVFSPVRTWTCGVGALWHTCPE